MTSITEQKAWEREMTALGISRFRAQEAKALDGGRFTDTSAGARLLRVYLSQVSAEVSARLASKGTRSMYAKLIRGVDPDKLAMFVLNKVVECLHKPSTVQHVAAAVGKMVEDELRFGKFEIELPEYYNAVQRDLDSRKSGQYRHRHRVMVATMRDKGVEWLSWTNDTHIGVGLFLLGCAEVSTDLIEREHTPSGVQYRPSAEVLDWIDRHETSIEVMLPDRMPCVFEPRDWTDWKTGGFYTARLSGLTPLVKTRAGQQRDTQGPLLDSADMPTVLASVNAMQKTSWTINTRILDVVREVWDKGLEIGMPRSQPYDIPAAPIPEGKASKDLNGIDKLRFDEWKVEARTLHGLEAERKANLLGVVRAMRLAGRLKEKELLWLVYQLDFRGRAYSTTSGVSPQGPDVSKALLKFGVAEKLGKSGWYWFRVHGANKYGYDKEDYDTRVKWVEDRAEGIIAAGEDPLGNTDVWKNADKPYQFLAWCMEFAEAVKTPGGPEGFESRLPIALDGSCNGLQHFSAMLRDPVGGKSVNLVPSSKPSDIYQDVADVATEKLLQIIQTPEHEHSALAQNWLGLFKSMGSNKMGRKLAKKPVMTLPYGSTLQTCTQSVHGWYLEQKVDFFPKNTAFKHSVFLAKVLWESIGEVVIAARAAMNWIQKAARLLAKEDHPIVYHSPIGFPLVQFSPKMEKIRIESQIGGRMVLQITKELPGVDRFKASSGSSPNFIHNCDSSHMHMVVAEGARQGITHFAMIHDDFGVHACHVDKWHRIIREQFVALHEKRLLEDFKQQQEARYGIELPDLPLPGSLPLKEVLNSKFFFG